MSTLRSQSGWPCLVSRMCLPTKRLRWPFDLPNSGPSGASRSEDAETQRSTTQGLLALDASTLIWWRALRVSRRARAGLPSRADADARRAWTSARTILARTDAFTATRIPVRRFPGALGAIVATIRALRCSATLCGLTTPWSSGLCRSFRRYGHGCSDGAQTRVLISVSAGCLRVRRNLRRERSRWRRRSRILIRDRDGLTGDDGVAIGAEWKTRCAPRTGSDMWKRN